jgi:hypothetical protein
MRWSQVAAIVSLFWRSQARPSPRDVKESPADVEEGFS